MKNCINLLGMLLLASFFYSCSGTSGKQNTIEKDSIEVKEKNNWAYSEDVDEMTDKKMYFANCTSTNEVELEFPYNGGSILELLVRNMNGKNEVVLHISKGIINMSVGSMGNIRMRFDDKEAVSYSYNSSDNGSLEYAFLDHSKEIINKLKQSKTVKIEVPVFNDNRTVFNFDVSGLNWEHK